MQALRAVVIFMSVLLVTGVAVLFFGIMNDWHKKEEVVEVSEDVIPTPQGGVLPQSYNMQPLEAFGDWAVTLPEGAVIQDMEAAGSLLYVRYNVASQNAVVVLDLQAKSKLGNITFN